MKAQYTDKELIAAIKSGGTERQRAIRYIYNEKGFSQKIIQFVKKNSGNFHDGQDVFHEGIIVLDRNIRQDKFRGESALSSYLYSICRFHWMNQIRKKAKMDYTEDQQRLDEVETENPESKVMSEERKNLLQKVISQLGERCQKILELWKLSYSMAEIAKKLGLSSAAMARKNKYRCHKSLMKYLEEHPEERDFLKA